MKDQKGSNDFAVQSKCVTSIYRTSSLANQIRCLRKNHLRLTIYHYISMKRQVFDMEMDQKPLPSGYLTDCHGKKHIYRWFTMVYPLKNGWIFPWQTVSHNQMVSISGDAPIVATG